MYPIIVPNFPKDIIDIYKNVNLFCDLIHTNVIGLLNTISRHIIFAMGIIIKNRKLNNIEDGINQVNKLYLQCGFKITLIHSDSEFEPMWVEMDDLGISLYCASKK